MHFNFGKNIDKGTEQRNDLGLDKDKIWMKLHLRLVISEDELLKFIYITNILESNEKFVDIDMSTPITSNLLICFKL